MVRTITIYLREFDHDVKKWMQEETIYKISNRYKQSHIAEDIGVTNTQMSRFLNNHKVSEDFYIKWFNWFVKNQ